MPEKTLTCRLFTKPPYSSREERSEFCYREYKEYFEESVLDVCGYRGGIGRVFPGKYVNVDMDSGADYCLNLDAVERLPFPDAAFGTVVCADGLEHLENIHRIFDEICRVARKSIIVSLPNAWTNAAVILGGLRAQFSGNRPRSLPDRHWTLPVDKPADRHRWFYSLSEADEMIRTRGRRAGFAVTRYDAHVIVPPGLSFTRAVRALHRALWTEEDFANLYAWVGWWGLTKEGK